MNEFPTSTGSKTRQVPGAVESSPTVETCSGHDLPPTLAPSGGPPGIMPLMPGYEVLGELGRGGMGVVYKARQLGLNRLVALKVVLHGAHAGSDLLLRFRNEAQAVARVQHPNIVAIHDISEHNGLPYFSLEYCAGGTLAQRLGNQGPMTPTEAARLIHTLALAVHAVHEHGIVHRDLKPGNILFTADGIAKVADFGLARTADSAAQTRSGAVIGTPNYMAPEQARGKTREIGPATDVYALGAILYECLTGGPPFREEAAVDTLLAVVSKTPVPPRSLRPSIPPALEEVCLRCLEKDPAQRPTSARQLANLLQDFLDGKVEQVSPVTRRSRAIVTPLVCLVLFALATVLGWQFIPPRGDPSDEGDGSPGRGAVTRPQGGDEENEARDLYALLIGVRDYRKVKVEGKAVANLGTTVADVNALHKVLQVQTGVGYRHVAVTSLLDREATRATILRALDDLAGRARPADQVIIYLGGSAVCGKGKTQLFDPDGYAFLCHDSRNAITPTVLTPRDLFLALKAFRGRALLLVDTCHAGALVAAAPASLDAQRHAILAACSIEQFAHEPDVTAQKRYGHSVFTHCLLEGLTDRFVKADTNRDGDLDLVELFNHLRNRMPAVLTDLHVAAEQQTPVCFPTRLPAWPIARRLE